MAIQNHQIQALVQITIYEDASKFKRACLAFLKRREAFYNSILAILQDIESDNNILTGPFWFAGALRGGEVVGCALHAQPDGLLLSSMPASAVSPTISEFLEAVESPRRVIGPSSISAAAVQDINSRNGSAVETEHSWTIFKVSRDSVGNEYADASATLCTKADESFVASCGKHYNSESPSNVVNVQEFLLRKLRSGSLYKLDDGGPKCIASVSGATERGIRISALYTPAAFRRRGYARTLVAALTKQLLSDRFEFVTLSVADDTRSTIDYTELGYRRIGSRISYTIG